MGRGVLGAAIGGVAGAAIGAGIVFVGERFYNRGYRRGYDRGYRGENAVNRYREVREKWIEAGHPTPREARKCVNLAHAV